MNKIKLWSLLLFLGTTSLANANAAAIFSIVPTLTTIHLRSDSRTIIPYTVTNTTTATLSGITIDPNYNTTAKLAISSNACSTLRRGESCLFSVAIPGQNQPTNFVISPRVCGFNQTVCSQPIASLRLNVSINTINHAVKAFIGLTNNIVYPITLIAGKVGVLGMGITGFDLSEPASIAVNLSGSTAYVTNAGTNAIFVIDTNSNQITKMFSVGAVPSATIVSPDSSTLYVANYNNGQTLGTVSVLNTVNGALLATIPTGNGPWGVAITPDGAKLYVTNSYDNTVSVINTATKSVIKTISVGANPLGVVATQDGTKVYVANTGSNTVSVLNTSNNQIIQTITVGNLPKGVAVSPNSGALYVTNWQDGTLSIINTNTNTVTTTVSLASGPLGVAVSPDSTQLYVTLDQTNAMAVVNLNTLGVQYVFTSAPQVTMGNFIG